MDFGLLMGCSHDVKMVISRINTTYLAEKGGSRTLREPYDSQTGFEDQRHHRAPSFSVSEINYLQSSRGPSLGLVYHSRVHHFSPPGDRVSILVPSSFAIL
jgi:hypothetical protein